MIHPGQEAQQDSFSTHRWVLRDEDGRDCQGDPRMGADSYGGFYSGLDSDYRHVSPSYSSLPHLGGLLLSFAGPSAALTVCDGGGVEVTVNHGGGDEL